MKLTAAIIEDETRVREVFIKLLNEYCPEIEIIGEAANIEDGYNLIVTYKPNLIFLDVQMPGGSGFDLLEKFKEPPFETIFITSYQRYAIRALKLSALDYLLKPIVTDDLLKITERVKNAVQLKEHALNYKLLLENLKKIDQEQKIAIHTKAKLEHVNLKDILYLKADSNYTSIHTINQKRVVVAKTLKEYEELLCEEDSFFMRVHRTFIVNIHHIKSIEKGNDFYLVLSDFTRLEVAQRNKFLLMEKFAALNALKPKNKL